MYTMGYTTFTAIQLPNPDSIVAEQTFDYPPHQILDENVSANGKKQIKIEIITALIIEIKTSDKSIAFARV